jgi:hypothetical protein
MSRIFISYRRSDSMAITGRIYDRLVAAFGVHNIFKDVDAIPPGVDFRTYIDDALSKASVVVVIIGQQWVLTTDDYGKRRLNNPDDFVRIEVETALKRENVLVIPVLVNDARMPPPEMLPPSLKELAYRNSLEVRNDPDFNHDVSHLIEVVRTRMPRSRRMLALGLAVVALAAILAAGLLLPRLNNSANADQTATAISSTNQAVAAALTRTAAQPSPAPASATPAPTAEATPTVSPTAEATQAVSAAPTVLYPDGRPLQALYDDSSFYILNTGSSAVPVANLAFEAIDAGGQPAGRRFDGDEWARFTETVTPGNCDALEIAQFPRYLRPNACKKYNALRTPATSSASTVFWSSTLKVPQFRVLWGSDEIARCDIAAKKCDFRVPKS